MKVIDISVMRGPNYWSNYRQQLIVMKLDLEKYEELPTDMIPGFAERLMRLIPTLEEHRCSRGYAGGLRERMEEGTWLGHVIEHVALELQCLAGMDCGYGRTRSADAYGVYNVVFCYELENAGLYAAEAAVRLVKAVAEKKWYNVQRDLRDLRAIRKRDAFGPSTQAIVDEARKRGIPVTGMNDGSLVMLGQGRNRQLFRATVMGTTSNIAVETVACKWTTKSILEANGIPVPKGKVVTSREELKEALPHLGYPLAVKPIDGNHGRGITTNIRCFEKALKAFTAARKISSDVIVEQSVEGDDYRFLVVNYKLVAAAKRTPAMVVGDGISTLKQLIARVNADPDRGDGHESRLTKITVDRHTRLLLAEQNLTLDSVIPLGKELLLKRTANLSTGGTSTDVTDLVHRENVFLAERIARLMQLDVCGIDIIASDVRVPFSPGNGAILEVNAGPGFRMHTDPSYGTPRNVAEPVIDMLYPNGATGRIPVVAITGTNGKTTTTRLIAHMSQQAGNVTGYTTTEGIYVNGLLIAEGDCTGPKSAKVVLQDPSVEFAVLECARGGILRSGLAFDHCNISIVTNVSEDHLGLKGINTIEEYARVKEVVPRSTFDDGYAILNADDDLVYAMKEEMTCNVVLFSRNAFNPRIKEHCAAGGKAITIENGHYLICDGPHKKRVLPVADIPLTFSGTAEFMMANILPAIGAAWLSGFSMESIRQSLLSFLPSAELTPGRMNLFEFDGFSVMLDYAHNEAGFKEIERFMQKVDATRKVGIIGPTGDRRDSDIRKLGQYAARIFDEIIIRHDEDSRGRTNEEMTALVKEGIAETDPGKKVRVISDEAEALGFAISNATPGTYIFACADHVLRSIELIRAHQCKLSENVRLQAS